MTEPQKIEPLYLKKKKKKKIEKFYNDVILDQPKITIKS